MKTLLIFLWIYLAMIALSFVEAYVEGRYPWHRRKVGWKLIFKKETKTEWKKILGNFLMIKPSEIKIFSGYHFFFLSLCYLF